jgi:Ca-activated chloride channel homolog
MYRSILFLSLFSALLFTAPAADLSDSNGPNLLEGKTVRKQQDAASPRVDIHVHSDMTLVPVTVMDSNGHNVRGLLQENFRIFDGSEQRPIASFSREDAPVSVALVFDSSRSMTNKFKAARTAAQQLFQQLNPEDEAFLVTVSDRAELRQDFTSNLGEIGDALVFTHPNGTTSLLDGVYLAIEHMKKAHNPRKAVVVVSDGGDNNSRYNMKELIARAQESDTLIYTVGLFANPQTPEEQEGPRLLSDLSEKTGGITFVIPDLNNLGNTMATIGVTLHNQYMLGYYPPENVPGGKYRKVTVQLLLPKGMPRLQVYARTGYYAPER